MNKWTLLSCGVLIAFIACNQQNRKERQDHFDLKIANEYIKIHLDDSTYIPLSNISYFKNKANNEYIVFTNRQKPELHFYNLETARIYKKIKYNTEGSNSIVKEIGSFYVKDLDEIYLVSPYTTILYKSDSKGNIISKFDFSKASNGEPLTTPMSSMGGIDFVDNKFQITQNINRNYGENMLKKSSMGAIIDTVNKNIVLTPLKYPPLITLEDIGTNAGFGYQYRRIFDGENFIYSFLYDDILYKVSPDHKTVKQIVAKSQYIPQIKINRLNTTDFNNILRASCEEATYEDIVYDKYRKVYYRFAFPKTEVDADDNLLEIIRSGKKQFSIMVLDKNLNITGEKLFPEFTYVPAAHFIREDGLYISCSHFKNPDYDDNTLCFQKIELIKKE